MDKPLVVTSSRAPAGIFSTWHRNVLTQSVLFGLLAVASLFGLYFYQRRQKQFSKQALESAIALKQSEEKYRLIVENSRDIIFTFNSKGEFVYLSPSIERVLGYSPAELMGRPFHSMISPEDLPNVLNAIRLNVEEDIFTGGTEYRVRHASGEWQWHMSVGNPIRSESGEFIFYTGLARDITERKDAEKKLALFTEELERSNKELDDFAYIASHDLKEPLRGIHNYSSFLLEDYADKLDADGKDKLNTLIYLTKRLESFINDLLKFSRVSRVALTMTETAMDEVAKDALTLLKPLLEKEHIDIRIPRPLPAVKCDHFQMVEVLQNLMSNSVKYNDKPDKWIEIGYNSDKNTAAKNYVFYVRDNGIGIDKKYFDSIFTIFKRLHGRDMYGGGTGAGLTIVKKIIERHGGKMWLESIPGEGTTFYFTLQGE